MNPSVFVAILVAIGIGFTFVGLDLIISSRRVAISKRLDIYRAPGETVAGEGPEMGTGGSKVRHQTLATELARAGLPITPGEFVAVTLLLGVLGALIAFALFRQPVMLLVGGPIGMFLPRLYLRRLQSRRLDAFNAQLESGIMLLANSLRSGFGLGQAIEAVSKESSPPLSIEFGRVTREIGLGISMKDALANLLVRNPSDDLDLIITAININHDVGGNLTEVLDRIAGTIRERVRLVGEMKTITSMQRFTGQILIAIPFVLTGFIFLVNSDYISLLWRENCGLIMLGVWGLLTTLGILTIRRLLAMRF